MRFAVVVPVYNVEKYLEKCILSILCQSYRDFELILIDDGSTDRSGEICDEYCAKDSRIKVIHQKNGGLSNARNTGIRETSSEYIVFVDSDDWIDSNSLDAFERIIERSHPEVIETIITEEYEDRTVVKDTRFSAYLDLEFTRKRALDWILHETKDTWPAPKRICKRSFIIDNDLFFAEGRLQEDIDWTTRLCCKAETFRGYDQPWYHYRMKREGSISSKIHAKFITDVIEMAAIDKNLLNDGDPFSSQAFNAMMGSVYITINLINHCNEEDKKKVISCVKQNMWIFEYTPRMKYRLFAVLVKLFGVDKSLLLLSYKKDMI